VKLRRRDGARETVCLFNTHFDVWCERARVESARLLRERMDRIAGAAPVIITGDFNDAPESLTYHAMRTGHGTRDRVLLDSFRIAHPLQRSDKEGTRHGFDGDQDGPRIDWIFTTPNMRVLAASINHDRPLGRYPSDHFPVEAVVRPITGTASAGAPVARIE
jgi:endonuclease/exonuclease/phosphatase family metal-dependent hydrolase